MTIPSRRHPLLARLTILAVLLAFSLSALAQAPGAGAQPGGKNVPLSKVERKGLAPVSKQVLQPKLPRAVKAKLDNGATVLIIEDHRFPTVNVLLRIPGAGGLYDPASTPGLASVTAQMLSEGTATRSSRQLAEDIETLGANVNANSGFGSPDVVLSANGLSDNLEKWFAIAADVLQHPSFPEQELNNLKQRLKVQLKQQRSNPNFLANERFSRAVFGTHPAAVISATNESIDSITPAMLTAWHKERYGPQNAILGIAGDVNAKTIVPRLNQWLADWKRSQFQEVMPAASTPATAKKIMLVDRPASVQATVFLGNIAIARNSSDYFPVEVMNRVVGGGPAGRLFLNLREAHGYTYGAYSFFNATRYAGPWRAFGDMRTDAAEGAMTEFFNEINRIRDEKVPAAELDESKRSLVANFALSLEQPTELLGYATDLQIYGFPDDYWDTYPARLMAVTAEDIQRVARKYVDPANLQVVAVGDATKLKPVLEKYGTVEVYDTEGKPASGKPAEAKPSGN